MKRYLAFDGINGDHEEFDTIEEAREWLEDCFSSPDEGYHPDFQSCKIYQLAETVECEVVDKQENYKYIYEDDIPEGDNESQAWPYSTDFDEIWKHRFVADKMVSERDDDVFDKMNCLIGYLERWLNNPQSNNPPAELRSVIDEAIEYLKTRDK